MTDDTTGPTDLEPLKQPLIEAVTNAYMAKNIEWTGFAFDHGSCEEGEFRYTSDDGRALAADFRYYVSYPDGVWRRDATWWPDGEMTPGEDSTDGAGEMFDAKAKFEEIATQVSAWIDPFTQGPEPSDFDDQIGVLQETINQLYVQDEVRIGETTIGGGEDGSGAVTAPTASVRSAIADTESDLEPLSGLAINNLKKNYTNDIGLTLSGQRALATVAGLAVVGEKTAWNATYADLVTFFTNATSDFNSFAASGGPDTAQTLSVLSGLAAIGAGLTAPVAPVAGAFTVVSGVTAVAANYAPEPREARIVTLEGGDFGSLWSSFMQAVGDINAELADAEHSLHEMVVRAMGDYDANPRSFSLSPARRFLGSGPESDPVELYAGDSIRVVHSRLRSVAGQIEHVGDHQRGVAGGLSGAVGTAGWSRGSLGGGSIGWGPDGHAGSYESIVDALTDLLLDESRVMHRLAEHCLDISSSFRLSDQDAEIALDRLEEQVR